MNPMMLNTKSGDAALAWVLLALVAAAMTAVIAALVRHSRAGVEEPEAEPEPGPQAPAA